MRKPTFGLLLCFAVILSSSVQAVAEEKWIGDINIHFGQKNMTPNYWKPAADQPMVGLGIDFGKESWPLHILLTVSASSRQTSEKRSLTAGEVDIEGATSEVGFGIKTHYIYQGFNPFLTLGVSWTKAALTGNPDTSGQVTDRDSYRAGIFLSGGVTYRVAEIFNVGAELRMLRNSEVRLFGLDGDADYIQYALIFGWSF